VNIKKLIQFCSAIVLSLSALLTLSAPLAHAATLNCKWTDASGSDNNFSDSGNWTNCGGNVPDAVGGDVYNLVFPASAAGYGPVVDIASLTVANITFTGGGYDLSSSGPSTQDVTITGGITDTSTGPNNEIDLDLTASGNQTFSAGPNSQLILGNGSDNLTVNGGNTLTLGNVSLTGPIVGTGTVVVNDANYPADVTGVDLLAASPSFTGNVSVTQGALFVDQSGALSAASQVTIASGALLKGNGGVSAANIESGGIVAPGHSPGCITANSVTMNGTYTAQIGGTTACTDYDQLQVSNSVNVTSGTLQLSLINGFTPSVGQSFEIIDNSGNSPVTGTFSGLPEGATFTSSGYTFQVSYKGGDGNDVTLTVVNPSSSSSAGTSSVTPKAPDTGFGAVIGNPAVVFVLSSFAAFTLIVLARRLKPAQQR
jgi:fibronectin-binding autotransporter adhesin